MNSRTIQRIISFTAFWLAAWCLTCVGLAQTTAFTYQGKLTDAGQPANNNYDLQFKLFDTVTVGTGAQQGATLVRNPVAVSAGVFTVTLDFGANVFSGADRYLEIGVRPAGSANAYTVLAPRQPITSSPYAIQTLNAQQLGGLPASSYLQNTTTPQAGANFNISGNGTMSSLNVNGPVSLGGVAAPAVAPVGQGRIYFDSATNKVKVSESGGAFVNLIGATGVSGSGTIDSIPLWNTGTTLGSSLITQSGNTINMPSPTIFVASPSGHQTQIGTPNTESGITFSGAGTRADLRYNGTLKLVNGPGGIPLDTNGLAITTAGYVGIGTSSPAVKLEVSTGDPNAIRGFTSNSNVQSVGVDGWSLSGTGVRGHADGDAGSYGVVGESLSGYGVYGNGRYGVRGEGGFAGVGVWGSAALSNCGGCYAGYFSGHVKVTGNLAVDGTVCAFNIPCSSDARLKQKISPIGYGLREVMQLRPVSWLWKDKADGPVNLGLIAQEVEPVLPELVLPGKDADRTLGLNYLGLIPVVVKAVQEQQAWIETQAQQIVTQKVQLKRQQRQLDALRKLICQNNQLAAACQE